MRFGIKVSITLWTIFVPKLVICSFFDCLMAQKIGQNTAQLPVILDFLTAALLMM